MRDRGLAGVSHRSVAAEAGVSNALTTYHFASKLDLLEQALRYATEETTEALRRRAADLANRRFSPEEAAAELADLLVSRQGDERLPVVSVYELYLASARLPALQPAMLAWSAAYLEVIEQMLRACGIGDPARAATVVMVTLDGLSVLDLAAPDPDFERETLRPALDRLLRGLAATGP